MDKLKTHTTNYYNTFIEIAEDSLINHGEVPPVKGEKKSIANYQFDMLVDAPYKYTSDEVFFAIHVARKEIHKNEVATQRSSFFSKGKPCFRASPLTKRYGWGIHSDDDGKIALYGADSAEYNKFLVEDSVKKVKAMRSSRK